MGEILFLAHRIPYPPDRGDKIRSYNILKRLCALGTVHVATFADNDADMAHGETIRAMLGSLHIEKRTISTVHAAAKALLTGKPVSLTAFGSRTVRNYVRDTLAERDIQAIFVFSGQMAQFVPELPPDIRFVTDFCDVDSAKFAAYAMQSRGPMRAMHRREARMLSAFERRIAQRADYSLFVSEAEADLFRTANALDRDTVLTMENGIDCAFFDPDANFDPVARPPGKHIVFTGQMDYRPNVEAAMSFVRDTLPTIRAACPDAQFAIVGRNPVGDIRRLAQQEGVIVTGGVPDIRSWLAAAHIVVAPLRMARGIQNKVLEAMAMARPVIASTAAFEGIDARPGEHLLVAETPQAEAQTVIDLLADRDRAEEIGIAARKHVVNRYVWDETLAPVGRLLGFAHDDRPAHASAGAA